MRNARAEIDRHARWAPARDALWQLLDTHMHHDTRVAIVGAGNADDLPLTQLARRAREVTLLDLDPRDHNESPPTASPASCAVAST